MGPKELPLRGIFHVPLEAPCPNPTSTSKGLKEPIQFKNIKIIKIIEVPEGPPIWVPGP